MGTNGAPPQLAHDQGVKTAPSRKKIWSERLKLAGSLTSALGIFVAIWVAAQGQVTVDRNSQATLQQSEDAQLSTAITAIGSNNTAEEIAGLLLLARNTSSRFSLMSQTKESSEGVFDDFRTALQILSGYLRSHGDAFLAGTGSTTRPHRRSAADTVILRRTNSPSMTHTRLIRSSSCCPSRWSRKWRPWTPASPPRWTSPTTNSSGSRDAASISAGYTRTW